MIVKKILKPLLLGILSLALFLGLNQRLAGTICISAYLNPLGGALWNAILPDFDAFSPQPGLLQSSVTVQRDSRAVPHIFAETLEDLFFAQGYTVASERLWQHDIQIRAASGRLSEVLGEQTLDYDRFMRRIGLKAAAEKSFELSMKDSLMKVVLESYSKGYNAFLSSVSEANLPVEFKLLGHLPEAYTPLNCFLMQSNLSLDLTFRNNDAAFQEFCDTFGDSLANELFPLYSPLNTPFANSSKVKDSVEVKVNPKIDRISQMFPDVLGVPEEALAIWEWDNPESPQKGSNNWAVAGGTTESGNPILCNDPHLTLTLPSIWIEMQLILTGKNPSLNFNSYGVTTAGIPSIILGFNKQIAWGATNAGSDVLDWYQAERNSMNPKEYLYQGKYVKFEERVEKFIVRGKGIVVTDTILESVAGPLVAPKGELKLNASFAEEAVMQWKLFSPNNSLKGILNLNRAKSIEEAFLALTDYKLPAQNFAIADTSGLVAIRHNGALWKRNKKGREGSKLLKLSDYEEFPLIPFHELPTRVSNLSGFIFSANQNPVDSSYPFYLGWDYASMERGTRIKNQLEILTATKKINREDLKRLQQDELNLYAKELLPIFLKLLSIYQVELKPKQQEALNKVAAWDYRYCNDRIEPTIFELWSTLFYRNYWEWLISKTTLRPSRDVTLSRIKSQVEKPSADSASLKDLSSKFFSSFELAIDSLTKEGSIPNWGTRNPVEIRHQARLPGFGSAQLPVSGSYNTVNAVNRNHGPSWRIVVELSRSGKPTAEVALPGGVSGKPHSKYYDSGVETWAKGQYVEALYLTSPDSANGNFWVRSNKE